MDTHVRIHVKNIHGVDLNVGNFPFPNSGNRPGKLTMDIPTFNEEFLESKGFASWEIEHIRQLLNWTHIMVEVSHVE